MNELVVMKQYEDGVLVGDPYGETSFMTNEEYVLYLENIKT